MREISGMAKISAKASSNPTEDVVGLLIADFSSDWGTGTELGEPEKKIISFAFILFFFRGDCLGFDFFLFRLFILLFFSISSMIFSIF